MKKILSSVIALFSIQCFASDVLVMNDIYVAAEGQTVAEAQTQAVTQGQQQAFLSLLKKMSSEINPDDFIETDVSAFVQDVSLSDEKVSPTSYKGNLSVRFKAELVRQLLMEKGVSFLFKVPEDMFLVPIFEENGELLVFDKLNPLLPHLSNKNYSDFFQIKTSSLDEKKLEEANLFWNNGMPDMQSSFLTDYGIGKVLVLHIKREGDVYDINTKVLPENSSVEAQVEFQMMDDRLELAHVLDDLIEDTFVRMKKKWIYLATKNVSPILTYQLLTPVSKVSDLKKIKDKINQLNFIEKVEIKGFKNKMLTVELSFRGEIEELRQKLLLNQMELLDYEQSDSENQYLLKLISAVENDAPDVMTGNADSLM